MTFSGFVAYPFRQLRRDCITKPLNAFLVLKKVKNNIRIQNVLFDKSEYIFTITCSYAYTISFGVSISKFFFWLYSFVRFIKSIVFICVRYWNVEETNIIIHVHVLKFKAFLRNTGKFDVFNTYATCISSSNTYSVYENNLIHTARWNVVDKKT